MKREPQMAKKLGKLALFSALAGAAAAATNYYLKKEQKLPMMTLTILTILMISMRILKMRIFHLAQ